MTLHKYLDDLPKLERWRENLKIQPILDAFIAMQTKIAKVVFDKDEYRDRYTGYRVLNKCSTDSCLPIKAVYRNGEVFLVRTDM
jgi:hypothetical protein